MDETGHPLRLRAGETYGARSIAQEAQEGRPSRRFLEASAADLAAFMPDPAQVARVAASLADAHDIVAPTGGMAVTRKETCDPPVAIGIVSLENAAESTRVSVTLSETLLDPDSAMELAAALIYHACAARATHDLARGFPSVIWQGDERGPAREPVDP